MRFLAYLTPDSSIFEPFLERLFEVEDSLARIDERFRMSPVPVGVKARSDVAQAAASVLVSEGMLVHSEEVVLALQGRLQRVATEEVMRAREFLRAWQKADRGDAAALLRAAHPGEAGEEKRSSGTDARLQVLYELDYGEDERIASWRRAVADCRRLPALLAAFVAWDAWLELLPEQRGKWRAAVICALTLRARGKTRHFLLPIDRPWRGSSYRRRPGKDVGTRLNGFLDWVARAVELCAEDFNRLSLAREQLKRALRGRRCNSQLGRLIDHFIGVPAVTAASAASALQCSRQAVLKMIPLLGPTVRELTGSERKRIWGI